VVTGSRLHFADKAQKIWRWAICNLAIEQNHLSRTKRFLLKLILYQQIWMLNYYSPFKTNFGVPSGAFFVQSSKHSEMA